MIKVTAVVCLMAALVAADWRSAPIPIFLREASDSAKDAYYSIITSTESDGSKKQQIAELVAQQPPKIQEAYKQFRTEMEERRKAYGASVNSQMADLSPNARAAIGDIHKVRSDDSLTSFQKREGVQKVLSDLTPQDRQAVVGIIHKFNVPVIKN
ncbi:hypothetical protein QR680_001030 [Steinernema hermaphroditum]|uniref:SXP/RAL-2 family protein Ani s 5-like cation-binding domain-containing protein n=1 Tax=Steinernema hermaphroditum TaxID=289476 RepID=A0AA39GWV9_9BILA|nr:hypothetical protein QR680_001030 [Steinernema hermaphroditum]